MHALQFWLTERKIRGLCHNNPNSVQTGPLMELCPAKEKAASFGNVVTNSCQSVRAAAEREWAEGWRESRVAGWPSSLRGV